MRCFKATIEYDGSDFHGFQWQTGVRTVQGALEEALHKRIGCTVAVAGAGRTDAGVHALGQVVSFQAETRIPMERLAPALNSLLPRDVSVRRVEEVGPAFHARFSASSRAYVYLVLNRGTPSALWGRYLAFVPENLDIRAMQTAANLLVGEQDFAAFANALRPEEPTCRELMSCRIRRRGDLILVRAEANAFLRGMVRTLVGTLLEIGAGKRRPEEICAIRDSRDRRQAGPSAPPQGLCLLKVCYGTRKIYGTGLPVQGR